MLIQETWSHQRTVSQIQSLPVSIDKRRRRVSVEVEWPLTKQDSQCISKSQALVVKGSQMLIILIRWVRNVLICFLATLSKSMSKASSKVQPHHLLSTLTMLNSHLKFLSKQWKRRSLKCLNLAWTCQLPWTLKSTQRKLAMAKFYRSKLSKAAALTILIRDQYLMSPALVTCSISNNKWLLIKQSPRIWKVTSLVSYFPPIQEVAMSVMLFRQSKASPSLKFKSSAV
jgi:hypothetical protein